LDPDDEATVRFLEEHEGVFFTYTHEVPVEGRSFGRDVVCCNADEDGSPCPGCERDLNRKFKGFINLIWDNAPVFKRNHEGRLEKDRDNQSIVIGHKPQVAVWGSGVRVFENLDDINGDYGGLRSRRFKVKRKGKGLDTKYKITPETVDSGPQAFTRQEKDLEQNKYDLNPFVKPLSYDEFLKELGEYSPSNGRTEVTPAQEAVRRNPFMRRASD
jgi:hypothetical protein